MAWTDSLGGLRAHRASLAADDWNNLVDALAAIRGLRAGLSADSMNVWTDELDDVFLRFRVGLTDANEAYADSLVGRLAYLVRTSADANEAYIDAVAALVPGLGALIVSLADDATNLQDAINLAAALLASALDALPTASDAVGGMFTYAEAVTEAFSVAVDALSVDAGLPFETPAIRTLTVLARSRAYTPNPESREWATPAGNRLSVAG
jgi:hypothetical protein